MAGRTAVSSDQASAPDLAVLRAELDELDRDLLATAARRMALVRAIGDAKSGNGSARPLFDRGRERDVYARSQAVAQQVGLPWSLARRLTEALVEASHEQQEATSVESSKASDQKRRFLMIGGEGRMAKRLAADLVPRGHEVISVDQAEGEARAIELAGEADIVMVAVPMQIAASMTATLAPHVREDALLCDINSLKCDVCAAMTEGRGEALGLHPMFGPTVRSLRRQKVVVCPVKPGPMGDWLRCELGRMGMELIETTPEAHDKMMAVVQVLVHFSTLVMGEALRRTGVSVEESLTYTSPIYRLELAFTGRLFAQSADLYAEIEMLNPYGAEVRRAFLDAADAMRSISDAGDREAFQRVFSGVSAYFEGFAGEAMELSDQVIDALVRRP
jgi:prephenate dehydrogenase/chorismate mutase